MASSGGYFGAGFAQGLGNAIAKLPEILQQRDLRIAREENTKLQQQQLKLKQKMLENQVNLLAAQPEILKNFGQFTAGQGGGQPAAAPQAGGLQQLMTAGGGDAAPAASAVPAPAAPALPVPQTSGGVEPGGNLPITSDGGALPEIHTMEPSLHMTKEGMLLPVYAGKVQPYRFDYRTVDLGNGKYQNIEEAINPVTAQVIRRRAVGVPVPSDTIENAAQMVEGFGVTRGTDIFKKLTQQMAYALAQPEGQRRAAMKIVEESSKAAAQGLSNAGADFSKIDEMGRQEKAQAAGAEATARQTAENATRPLTAELQTKHAGLTALERSLGIVDQNYDPSFVGKGFAGFSKDLQDSVTDGEKAARKGTFGGLGGAVRTFTGDISPKEVVFRKAVVNASNQLLYALSGQQINEAEYKRLKTALFSLTDEPTVFKAGLQGAITETGAKIDDMLSTASTPAAELKKQRGGKPTITAPDLEFSNVGLQSAFEKIKRKFPKMTAEEMASYYDSHGGTAQ